MELLDVDQESLKAIESGEKNLSKSEMKIIADKIGMKYMTTGKKIIKGLDLIF